MRGTWGSFWLAWGWLVFMVTMGVLPAGALVAQALGFWFIGLAVVTPFGALAAPGDNLALASVLWLLTIGAALLAAGLVGGIAVLVTTGGWVLVFSAGAAFSTAGAMMLASRPTGEWCSRWARRAPRATFLPPGHGADERRAWHAGSASSTLPTARSTDST